MLFSHAGTYIGKANLKRSSSGLGVRPGLPDRLVEHMVALCFPHSRDGTLARYKVLRQSMPSVTVLPLRTFDSEARCLAAERALILSLKPLGNGAHWTAL